MSFFKQTDERVLDVICLGRAGVDLYAREAHTHFSEVSGFEKYVGGSPANISAALAKLGRRVGFIGAVSDDGLGRYVCDYLRGLGVDLGGMQIKQEGTRTSLAVTEMRPDKPEVVIYRNHAADLALQASDIDPAYIAQSRGLLLSGTALCVSPSREAALLALDYARRQQGFVVLDMDYRAYSWESPETAALYYHITSRQSDILIGNQEEFAVLQPLGIDVSDDDAIASHYMQAPTRLLIIKKGEQGCHVYHAEGDFEQGVFPVEVQKPFGAGDAFAGSLLYGLLNKFTVQDAVMLGSAAAAINVSRNSCSEAMPDKDELTEFLQACGKSFPEPIVSS